MMMNKFDIVYADPPWSFNNKNTGGSMKSGASAKYPTMTVGDICNLPVKDITSDNAILFMWWVGTQPVEAVTVATAWGFEVKTMTGFVWVKKTKYWKDFFGMGFYTRQGSENCLIATKGKTKRVSRSVRAVTYARVEGHSKKPQIFRDKIIDLIGNKKRIELFAREYVSGWDSWGDEVSSTFSFGG